MNLLNYFNTFDGLPDRVDNCTGGVAGAPTDCRGADTQVELDRQTAKTVAAIAKIDADVIGINEIENDGYGPDSAISDLVDAVNGAVGAGTYAFIDVDARTGQTDALGDDAIKVGFLYKPAAVTPVGGHRGAQHRRVRQRRRLGTAQPARRSPRRGAAPSPVACSSRTSTTSSPRAPRATPRTPVTGRPTAPRSAPRSVSLLLDWLGERPDGHAATRTSCSSGDHNSYAKETPIATLEAGGFTNLVEKYQGAGRLLLRVRRPVGLPRPGARVADPRSTR